MAIFRPGPTIGAISGNLGGTNFAAAKGSPFIRQRKVALKNPSTEQLATRSRFQLSLKSWATMPDATRLAWNAGSALITWPNRLGVYRQLSGFQLYQKFYLEARALTPIALDPPFFFSKSPAVPSLEIVSSGPNVITANWSTILGFDNDVYHWWGHRTHSDAPATFYNRWTFLGPTQPSTPFTSQILTTLFNDALGEPETGERFAVAVRLVPGDRFAGPLVFASTLSV